MSRPIICDICKAEIVHYSVWQLHLVRINADEIRSGSGDLLADVIQKSLESIRDLCNDCRVEIGTLILESRSSVGAAVLKKRAHIMKNIQADWVPGPPRNRSDYGLD